MSASIRVASGALLLLLHISCSNAPEPRSIDLDASAKLVELAAPPAAEAPPEPPPRAPLFVPLGTATGPLIEPARAVVDESAWLGAQKRISGYHFTTYTTASGVFVLDRDGVTGPLASPNGERIVAAGPVGKKHEILVVTATGAGFIAQDPAAAMRADGFRALATSTLPTAFDTAGDVVAVADASTLFVSLDGGAKFTRIAGPSGLRIAQVHARADGVVLVVGEGVSARGGEVFISKRARALLRSSYQPESVGRVGGVLMAGWGCQAALTADGSTWWSPEWPGSRVAASAPRAGRASGADASLVDMVTALHGPSGPRTPSPLFGTAEIDEPYLQLTWHVRGDAWPLFSTPSTPATPARAPANQRAVGAHQRCSDADGMISGMGSGGFPQPPMDCRGADCLRNAELPRPIEAAQSARVFSDAWCAPNDVVVEDHYGLRIRACRPRAKLAHTPTLALLNHAERRIRAVRPPSTCTFDTLLSSRGLTLLPCEEGSGTALLELDADGSFRDAGRLARRLPAQSLAVSDDGTAVLRSTTVNESAGLPRTTSVRFHVRAPAQAGAQPALRDLGEDVVFALPLRAGQVLVARSSEARPTAIELGVDAPAAAYTVLGRPLELREGNAIGLALESGGRVLLTTHPTLRGNQDYILSLGVGQPKPGRFVVMNDGTLEPLR